MKKIFTQKGVHPFTQMLLIACFLNAFSVLHAQERRVSGIVLDSISQPIIGASIKVKGSATGVATDQKGEFTISVTGNRAVLVVTSVGFTVKEVPVNAQTRLTIMLSEETTGLAEVAVVGFGTQRKVSLIGAQSTVNAKDLKQPVQSVTQSLAGRIAGVVGVQRSGEPGRSAADIWVRGIATFGGNSSSPLILVDGVQRSINNIDPEDIESFTVLKDASGTAVYGVRGANGVVLVNTKKGKVGKPQIFFDYNEGISNFTRLPQLADGVTYMNLANEALVGRGQSPRYTQDYIANTASGTDPLLYPNVNWMDEIFRQNSRTRRANLNASGGVENAQYYVSLAYFNDNGLFNTSDLAQYNSAIAYNRYNFTSNLNLNITGTTKLDLGIQGYASNGNYQGETTATVFGSAFDVSAVEFPVQYPGGLVPGRASNGGFRNPYADLTRRGYRTEFENQVYSNLRATQDLKFFTDGLSATAMIAFDARNANTILRSKRENTYFIENVSGTNSPYRPDGTLNLRQTFTSPGNYLSYVPTRAGERRFYTEAAVNYNRLFGNHQVTGLILGYTQDDNAPFAGDFTASIPARQVGLAARTTYSYKDRYFAEFNLGYNGSETFSPENRYGFFPAFGVGWVPSNEKWWEPVNKTISYLKFRYSDGKTGIGTIGGGRRFAYLTLVADNAPGYTLGTNFAGNSGINVTDYGIDVRWTESRKQDLGMEIRTLKDNLYLIVDLFKERRTGIFLQRASIPGYVGLVNQPFGNLGIVDNRGIDATLEYNFRARDFEIGLRGTFTYNRDKLVEDDLPTQPFPWMERVGNNILASYGYVAEKLFDNQAEIDASPTPGSKALVLPGDIKYRDLNGDGLINNYDVTQIGRGDVPSTIYGATLTLGYKGFGVSAFLQGTSNANRIISGSGIYPFNGGGGLSNAYAIVADRWTPQNPSQNVFYPRLAYGEDRNFNNTQPSSWWVKDMSFLRLKTAQISYNLPKAWAQKLYVKNAAIYLIGTNLLNFSEWKLWDPELNTGNGSVYPLTRTISLGANIRF